MKKRRRKQDRQSAFTLVEMLVSTGVMTIAGGSIYLAVNASLNLFAKNTSLNVAHEQLVRGVQRITRDAHASIATPTLLNSDLSANSGSGPAAGVAFEVLWQRPFKMTAGGNGGTNKITIDTGTPPGPRPVPGQRAYLPGNDDTEENITIVAANVTPAYSDITLQNSLWKKISPNAAGYDRPVIIADRIAYVVVGNSMHFYAQTYSGGSFSWLDRGIRVRNVTSPTPFSITNSRTVTGNLTVSDPTYSNRGYKALGMPLTFQAPYRTKLSIY